MLMKLISKSKIQLIEMHKWRKKMCTQKPTKIEKKHETWT